MKKVLSLVVLLVLLGSCKVTELASVETLAKLEMLKEYRTFKMIEEDSDKRNERIKLIFRDKLIDFGFEEASENPDFLIQVVMVTREFIEKEGLRYSTSNPRSHYGLNSNGYYDIPTNGYDFPSGGEEGTPVQNRGMLGKVIFVMQDSKTNEIAWMGTTSGVVYGGDRQFDMQKIDLALQQLLTSLFDSNFSQSQTR